MLHLKKQKEKEKEKKCVARRARQAQKGTGTPGGPCLAINPTTRENFYSLKKNTKDFFFV
jgi:hypothetical protein